MKHTPTPWMFEVVDGMPMITHDGDAIAVRTYCFARSDDNDLEHIVKCVNAHDGLVAALRLVRDNMTYIKEKYPEETEQCDFLMRLTSKKLESLKDD